MVPAAGSRTVREILSLDAADLHPSTETVLRCQGVAGPCALAPNWASLVAQASDLYLRRAEPRALVDDIERDEFAAIYAGEGRNDSPSPVADIFPLASHLALFVVTLGDAISREIARRFEIRDFAVGHMLDGIASAAAESAARRAALRRLAAAAGEDSSGPGLRALEYSPGYCGWDVSGQRKLFARLQPEEIGVRLNDSCLMQPLKSVSGVIIVGAAEIHRVAEVYPCCAKCRTRDCRARWATL